MRNYWIKMITIKLKKNQNGFLFLFFIVGYKIKIIFYLNKSVYMCEVSS